MKSHKYATKIVSAMITAAVLTAILAPGAQTVAQKFSTSSAFEELHAPPLSVAFHSDSVLNPNGTRNFEVYVMNADGTDQTRLTFDPRVNQQPDISPNGHQIVFCGNAITPTNPEGDLEIYIMDSDGSNITQLTFNGAGINDCWPRWSPNGKRIAFHSNVAGNFEIYTIQPDGEGLTRVTNYAGLDQFPEWSPNGKQLSIRRDTDLYLINVDGTDPIQLTFDAPVDQMASWSPNGKQIAYMSLSLGYCAVFVMNSDGSEATNLTPKPDGVPNNQFCSRAPAWSRNGQQIYFSSFRPETDQWENIFVMDVDGGNVTRLTFDHALFSVAAVR